MKYIAYGSNMVKEQMAYRDRLAPVSARSRRAIVRRAIQKPYLSPSISRARLRSLPSSQLRSISSISE